MSIKRFINKLFKKNNAKSIKEKNERLRIELRVLEKLEKELKDNYSKN